MNLKSCLKITPLVILFALISHNSVAVTVDEIQAKIDATNKNRQALEKEIAEYQKQLNAVSSQATTLQNNIKSLDLSASKITTEVKLVENNIVKTTYSIQDTDSEISDKQKQINLNRRAITETLRQMYRSDNDTVLELLLGNSSLTDFWNDIESTLQIQDSIREQTAEVKSVKAGLEVAKSSLEIKKAELEKATKELNDRKLALQAAKKEKATLLSTTKNTEANYQKILRDKIALKESLDQEINSFESQLRLVVDPKSFPPAGKGILSWPVENVFITQNFGKTSVSGRLYVSGTHNGVDFRAPIGTKVMAAASGVVEGTGDTDTICPGASYGKWVFIRHDNGLATVYGHLSVISAVTGQKVKAGDTIAYSGKTGYSTGPHLHLSVFAGQGVKVTTLKSVVCKGTYTIPLADPKAYLDPLVYL